MRQIDPIHPDRIAKAPYNFVPLPQKLLLLNGDPRFEVQAGSEVRPIWSSHDRYASRTRKAARDDIHSGWIDVAITTLTPLFIRGYARRNKNGEWDQRSSRFRPDPAMTVDDTPVIPGSSLRGAIRALVEILSFAAPTPVHSRVGFFRTLADNRLGRHYSNQVRHGGRRPAGGFVQRRHDGWVIVPAKGVVRVGRDIIPQFRADAGPNATPSWEHQHRLCWFRTKPDTPEVTDILFSSPREKGWRSGTLVLTGNAPQRSKREFIFLHASHDAEPIQIPEHIWTRFHDPDQISNWQERAFPRDRPTRSCRPADGYLRENEPVFFVADRVRATADNPAGLLFFGRAQLFRIPYDTSADDLVPPRLKSTAVDLASSIFGRTLRGLAGDEAIKGRVRFESARLAPGTERPLEDVLVPQVLVHPHPTAFQHYLVQDGRKGPAMLATYVIGDVTEIRGHKLYWHRWDERGLAAVRAEGGEKLIQPLIRADESASKQHTVMRPVRAGVTFHGRIHFDQLTEIEIGALLTAIRLPQGCAQKLGGGKPLGFGSVSMSAKLVLIDRRERYSGWASDGIRRDVAPVPFEAVFTQAILKHALDSGETVIHGGSALWDVARLDALRLLLSYDERPPREETRYLRLDEFRARPVLPTPSAVANRHQIGTRHDAPPPATSTTPLQPGQRVRAVLLDKVTKSGRRRFIIAETNDYAVLHESSDPLPETIRPRDGVDLEVVSIGSMIEVRYVRAPGRKA